jgi:hypothetical protein
VLDFETGTGLAQVNPSCTAGGECFSAHRFGEGNFLGTRGSDDGGVTMVGSFLSSSRLLAPAIDMIINFSPNASGIPFIGVRDAFPSFELTSTGGGFITYRETDGMALFGPVLPFWGILPRP